jgi:hypothetical protein
LDEFTKLEKTFAMKRLLLIISITLSPFLLRAQTGNQGSAKPNDKNVVAEESHDKEMLPDPDAVLNQPETDYSVLRPKNLQPGINRLQLDGISCLVPNTDNVVSIPNAWKGPLRVPFKKKKPAASYNDSSNSPVL